MFTVTRRVYGRANDGRTVLLYAQGMTISDDEAKRAGLVRGPATPEMPAKGLTIKEPRTADDTPPKPKPLERMTLAELRDLCAAEGIDPDDANTRADFIAAIELAREAAGAEG